MKKSRKISKKRKKQNYWLYIIVAALAFMASMGGSYLYFEKMFEVESDFLQDIEARSDRDKKLNSKTASSRLYEAPHLDSEGKGILRKDALLVTAENIIRKYFLSYEVQLLDLYMDKRGVIYIDIGGELKRNFKGDALEELSLIAGLYKEIKSTVSDFTALMILIEGREAESLGGHIDISRPIGEQIVESI